MFIPNATRPRGKTLRDYPGLPRALVRDMLCALNRGPTPTEWKLELAQLRRAHQAELDRHLAVAKVAQA